MQNRGISTTTRRALASEEEDRPNRFTSLLHQPICATAPDFRQSESLRRSRIDFALRLQLDDARQQRSVRFRLRAFVEIVVWTSWRPSIEQVWRDAREPTTYRLRWNRVRERAMGSATVGISANLRLSSIVAICLIMGVWRSRIAFCLAVAEFVVTGPQRTSCQTGRFPCHRMDSSDSVHSDSDPGDD